MNVIITGSTGMVGKGVLLECIDHPKIEKILLVNRSSAEVTNEKVKEILISDFMDMESIRDELSGYDACFFCMGISAFRLTEDQYRKITYDVTMKMASTLYGVNPAMTFIYVSGQGTDSSEKGRVMWARVKGKTENDLLKMGFANAYMFRPGYIQPMRGIKSKTKLYNNLYIFTKPLYPVFKLLSPSGVTTSVNVGKAMINVALNGSEKEVFETKDINLMASEVKS